MTVLQGVSAIIVVCALLWVYCRLQAAYWLSEQVRATGKSRKSHRAQESHTRQTVDPRDEPQPALDVEPRKVTAR